MKTFKTTFAILIIALLSFSCNKDDDNSTPTPSGNDNFIRCKIEGVNYEALGNAILVDQNTVAFNFRSDISGGGTGLDFSINGEPTVGTYNFNGANVTTVGRLNYKMEGTTYSSGICTTTSGTLTIVTKNGKTIEGTFSIAAKRAIGCLDAPKLITDGTFKITFP